MLFRCTSNAVMVLEDAEISSRLDQLVEETLGWKSTGGLLLEHADMRHGEEDLASSRTIDPWLDVMLFRVQRKEWAADAADLSEAFDCR